MKDSQFSKKKPKIIRKKTKPRRLFITHAKVPKGKSESGDKNSESWSIRKLISSLIPKSLSKSSPTAHVADQPVKSEKQSFFKINKADLGLFLIPVVLLSIFLVLQYVNNDISRTIEQNKLIPDNSLVKINEYPFVQKVQMPDVSAKAAIIIDADSQVELFSKNTKLRFSMASTTKIMTALIGLSYYQDESILTVLRSGVEGSALGLMPGETFYFKDLLYAMLLPSANDAAYVIADNYPGGADAFVMRMNEKAAMLHLSDTNFSDPTGLDDDGDYTTAVDLARLASHAVKNQEFKTVTSTKRKVIATVDYAKQYELGNLNKLLGIDGVDGIKTGTTEGAGEVLVTSTVQNGHTFIIVVMNSQQRFIDTQALISFIKQNVQYVAPVFDSALN